MRKRILEAIIEISYSLIEYLSLFNFDPFNSLIALPLSQKISFIMTLSTGATEEGLNDLENVNDSMEESLETYLLRWSVIGETERGRERVIYEINSLLRERAKKRENKWKRGSIVCVNSQNLPSPFRCLFICDACVILFNLHRDHENEKSLTVSIEIIIRKILWTFMLELSQLRRHHC